MKLRYRIRIERKGQVQAADGSLTTTRTLLCEAYAQVQPMRGSERDQSMQTEAAADYKFTIRRRGDIREDDIIVWQGTDYNIRAILDYGPQSLYLTLEAQRGVAV